MNEEWRSFLYPLGFLSSFFFGARFLLQWIDSEARKESRVTWHFWALSLVANILLWVHAVLQLQIHIAFVQSCNAVISWRNLDLMRPAWQRLRRRWVYVAFVGASLFTFLLFFLQSIGVDGEGWFRTPLGDENRIPGMSPISWHVIGTVGIVLFSGRFWVQWWEVERLQRSYLAPSFWWISLSGAFISICYFAYLWDPVNLIGPCLGTVPYVRNLALIYGGKKAAL